MAEKEYTLYPAWFMGWAFWENRKKSKSIRKNEMQANQKLLPKVAQWIEKYKLIQTKERVVVGVSGGVDSTALLLILHELSNQGKNFELSVACVDHALREESKEEVLWVQNLTEKLQLPFFTTRLDFSQQKSNIEEHARNCRYQFFEQVAQKWGAKKVALAHHANDHVETTLLHFLQGTGLSGLKGMPLQRKIYADSAITIIRPLLCCTKQELTEYLQSQQQNWCEDRSNYNTCFTRNLIRHQIIPMLKKNFPTLETGILSISEHCQETVTYLEKNATILVEKICHLYFPKCPKIHAIWEAIAQKPCICLLDCEQIPMIDPALEIWVLQKILHSLGITGGLRNSHYVEWKKLLRQNTGKINLPNQAEATKTPRWIYITLPLPLNLNVPQNIFPNTQTNIHPNVAIVSKLYESHTTIDYSSSNFFCVHLAGDELEFPLQVRFCTKEDSIRPFGSSGHQTIFQMLADRHIPLSWRSQMLVVCSANGYPIWIPGLGTAELTRITSDTKNICELECKFKTKQVGLNT